MPPSFLQTFVYYLYLNKASKEEQALVFTYIYQLDKSGLKYFITVAE